MAKCETAQLERNKKEYIFWVKQTLLIALNSRVVLSNHSLINPRRPHEMLDMLYVNSKMTLLRINVKHYKSNDWLARLTWRRKKENGRNKSCVNGLLERCLIYLVFRGPLAGHSHQLSLEISYPGNTYSKANDFCMALPYPLLGKATEKLKRFDGSQFIVYWKSYANLRWKINNFWLGFIL